MREEKQQPEIIFEDDSILVLGKPAGWITNSATTTKGQPVLQDWLARKYNYETAKDSKYRAGIVHRLDKETSGILLVAKTKKAFANLQKQFKDRKVKKTYTALVHGRVEPKSGEINVPVGRLPWNRERFGVLPGGRPALTDYEVSNYYSKGKESFTLVQAKPKTGRTHQIRIHMKHLGHPIVADDFYAGRKTAREDRTWCPRLFLHASQILFVHPDSGKIVHHESNLPQDLSSKLTEIKKL